VSSIIGDKKLDSNITIADKIKMGIIDTREFLFFQSEANIIEKTLGDGEIMNIRPECLIAFAPTCQIKKNF
jgi:hypothetical protein